MLTYWCSQKCVSKHWHFKWNIIIQRKDEEEALWMQRHYLPTEAAFFWRRSSTKAVSFSLAFLPRVGTFFGSPPTFFSLSWGDTLALHPITGNILWAYHSVFLMPARDLRRRMMKLVDLPTFFMRRILQFTALLLSLSPSCVLSLGTTE